MSNKWVRIAFVGAIGAGMVANFAYQSVVMGQVESTSDPAVQEGVADAEETTTQDVIVEVPTRNSAAGSTKARATSPGNRRTIEVVSGQEGIATTAPAAVYSGERYSFPGMQSDIAHVYRMQATENSELNASELAVAKLLKELQAAEEDDKSGIVDKIKEEVLKQFELRQEARSKDLKELEEQLAKLKQKHEKRESMKEKIVEDRVSQLVNNLEGLGWGTEPVPFGSSGFPGSGFGTVNGWLSPAKLPFGTTAELSLPATPAVPPTPAVDTILPVVPAAPSAPAQRNEYRSRNKDDNGGR